MNSCLYGVLMEYSKGKAGNGNSHHSEEPVGRKSFDCNLVDDSFKKVCYISSGFYRQYEADSEPWENTYRFCTNVANTYKQDCFNGIGGALLFSNAYIPQRASAICKSLPEDVKNYCLKSF